MSERTVTIGGAAGFWGDSAEGAAQLLRYGGVDYLVLDYLAEITMSILARMKEKDPSAGYATDFVNFVAEPLAREISERKVKVVTNAGGINPEACREVLNKVFESRGIKLKIAVVWGDNIFGFADELRAEGVCEMFSGESFPTKVTSLNAYLGALPIAEALRQGADIVLTGRVADSALALGPLIHEFGWDAQEYDALSAGSLAGHIIECGAQATGGIFTDWREVHGWHRMGFPIAICRQDGSFEVTKPAGTGGKVTTRTVAEQIVYEVGDPENYILPDVICDFSNVVLRQVSADRVLVKGAKGKPPTRHYKVSGTYSDGFKSVATMTIIGRDAVGKAKAVGDAIVKRAEGLIFDAGLTGFEDVLIEVIGSEYSYGDQAKANRAREVVLRIAVKHNDKRALSIFSREVYPAATAMAVGITGFAGGRPVPQPVIRLFSCLIEKQRIGVGVSVGGENVSVEIPEGKDYGNAIPDGIVQCQEAETYLGSQVPLIAIAHGRSGDKGRLSNVGLLAREAEFLPLIREQVTELAVKSYLEHFVKGEVRRYEWPGLNGFNFILDDSLGGGGIASLRNDPQGKAFAQILLDMPISIPPSLFEKYQFLKAWKLEPVK